MTIEAPPFPSRGQRGRRVAGRLALGSGLSVLLVGGALVPAVASPVPGVAPAAASRDSPRPPGAPNTPGTPVAKVLPFTGSPLAVTVVALGLLLAAAGAWLVVASRRRPAED